MSNSEELMRHLRSEFLDEASHLLDTCEEVFLRLDDPDTRADELAAIFRAMHTMKGSGGIVGLTDLVAVAHVVEDCLSVLREEPDRLTSAVTTLLLRSCDALRTRVDAYGGGRDHEAWEVEGLVAELKEVTSALRGADVRTAAPAAPAAPAASPAFGFFDENEPAAPAPAPGGPGYGFFDESEPAPSPNAATPKARPCPEKTRRCERTAGSVKIDAARIETVLDLVGELVVIKSQLMNKAESYGDDAQLTGVVALLDKTVRELQDKTLSMRLTPLKPLFIKLERLARDLSLKVGKDVEVVLTGEDTEIDRTMVEVMADPLLHLVRNALDHGLEGAEERAAASKATKGRLHLAASQRGTVIELRVEDDGRGIDPARIVKKAIERGFLPAGTDGSRLPEREIYDLLMRPGFSTAERVSDLSGRGVGLDVVKTHVEKLRGSIHIESAPGLGTTFVISLPLTASIRDGMIVQVDGFPYVLPMDRIRELVKVKGADISTLSGTESVLRVRDRVLPWVDLSAFAAGGGSAAARDLAPVGLFVVIEQGSQWLALRVDEVIGQMQVVMKPLDPGLDAATGVTGAAVLGDGRVALILDTEGLSRWARAPQAVR